MSNVFKQRYVLNITSEKRVIDSDSYFQTNYKAQQGASFAQAETVPDGFRAGIPMEVVEIQPEITPEELLEEARLEASQIIDEAKSHAKSLKYEALQEAQKAYEEQKKAGFAEGHAEAAARAETELNALKNQLYAEIEEKSNRLDAEYDEKLKAMESEVIDAIIMVFNKVFHIQFDNKKEILLYLVNDVLMNVDTGKEFRIRVSSENRKYLEEHIPEIKEKIGNDISIEVINDMGLTEEGCIIETDGGIFNCGIDMQLSNLEKDIRSLCL
uniref:FliH/SctL family protein n=1 Tax=Agathobacter sp. TaxID=2021311 RepID=UPI004055AE25